VLFDQIGADALNYSKANKCPDAYRIDKWHYALILAWFKGRVAKEIRPQEIDEKLSGLALKDELKPATLNRLPRVSQPDLLARKPKRQGGCESGPSSSVTKGEQRYRSIFGNRGREKTAGYTAQTISRLRSRVRHSPKYRDEAR
jgi:hypothetical protein